MKYIITLIGIVSLTYILHAANGESSNGCPPTYSQFSNRHSYCLPRNTSCEVLAFYPTDEDKITILHLHNTKRSKIATGQERLPTATNMLQMEWDDELSAVAQKYSDQCLYAHDCPNCRRVQNFGVGQNIAIQKTWKTHQVPTPDWSFAVNSWYSEIEYIKTEGISNFQAPGPNQPEYRHFSQLVWSHTFRVGCGYVLFKTGDAFMDETFYRLYICNYGPAGNIYDTAVYEEGKPCSNCPENTLCRYDAYPGLCKRSNDQPPHRPLPFPNIFVCAFNYTPQCDSFISGTTGWTVFQTLEGNYLGITLQGGETSILVFKAIIIPSSGKFCATLKYRKGPDMDGNADANQAQLLLYLPKLSQTITQTLPGYDRNSRFQFCTYNMTLNWNQPTIFKIKFSVPPGAPPQFFDVKEVVITEGMCHKGK